jgi:hypothetical protein
MRRPRGVFLKDLPGVQQDQLGFMSGWILMGTEHVIEYGIATRPPEIVRPLPEVFPPPRGIRRIAVTLIDITIRITSHGWSAFYHPGAGLWRLPAVDKPFRAPFQVLEFESAGSREVKDDFQVAIIVLAGKAGLILQ